MRRRATTLLSGDSAPTLRDPLLGQRVHDRLGRETMELASHGNPCDGEAEFNGEPTSLPAHPIDQDPWG